MAGKYVPRCQVDGTYDEVQCDVAIGQCWCVDRDGREIKGTRSEGIIRCPGQGITDIKTVYFNTLESENYNDF